MALGGCDFFTYNKIKTIGSSGPEVTGPQGALNDVMIGNSNHIQVSVVLHMLKNLFDCAATVTISAMHMQICLAMLTSVPRLLWRHFATFFEHRSTMAYILKILLPLIEFACQHV